MFQQKNDPLLGILGDGYGEEFFRAGGGNLKNAFDRYGILVLADFLSPRAVEVLQKEAASLKSKVYRSSSAYNLYVLPFDESFSKDSPRNRQFSTTKGCIANDQIPANSYLRILYDSRLFRSFLCQLLGIEKLYPYADGLSSININYYDPGDGLEWHFDNSDFAITLLVKKCMKGGEYEYFTNMRYDANGQENYELVRKCIDGELQPDRESVNEGGLMIFRGNKSLHRVTPVEEGDRILITFNFNAKPGVSLSEKSRQTFFGRVS
ncbi:MAG: 2OG-Fe(II) oxygenase [Patescibacteria group bacterium]